MPRRAANLPRCARDGGREILRVTEQFKARAQGDAIRPSGSCPAPAGGGVWPAAATTEAEFYGNRARMIKYVYKCELCISRGRPTSEH